MSDLEPTVADFHQPSPSAPPRRSRVGNSLRRAFAVALVAASLTCGGDGGSTLTSTTSGVAYWSGGGPVRNATIVAWQMVDGERTFELGRATTDANGRWELTTEGYEHIEFDVVGGSYVEASGGEVTLDSNTILRGIVLDVPIGGTRSGITISPLTDLAVTLGHARRAANKEDTYGASVHKAVERLTNHFGFDPLTTPVASPAAPASSPTAEVKYGLVLAGLSQLARSVADQHGATTQSINTVVWTRTLARDAGSAEALLDGVGAAPLFVGASCPPPPGCSVEGPGCYADCRAQSNTLKARIGAQILSFLRTSQNGTTLTRSDVEAWLEEVRVRVDADLFGSDPAEEWDQIGPTITWVTPAADASVAGSIAVEVTAADPLGIASLTVTAGTPTPMQLVDTDPAPERFAATFSTVGLPEGALTLTATATDSQENRSDAPRAIDINNIAFGTGSGLVYKGRIANASVRIYAFQGGVRGTMLGQGTTTSSGAFENVQIADGYNGPLLVEAGFAGTYPEEAASATVTLDVNDRLRTVIPSYTDGGAISSLVISPLTSFATTYFEYLQQTNQGGSTLAERWTTARTAMETHFGAANIYSLTPQSPSEMTTFNAGARYGMIMVGLSETARMASTLGGGDGGTFGSAMNAMRVFRVLDTDLADGCWDGRQGAMQLFFGGTRAVSNQSVRLALANAIVTYLNDGARNQTPYDGAADVLGQLDALASGGGNTAPGSCSATGRLNPDAGDTFDQSPPTIAITVQPNTPFVGGVVMVSALATDDLDMMPSLTFTTPSGTTDLDGDPNDRDAAANIDTRTYLPNMEGNLTVSLESFDDSGNRGTGQVSLNVDNVAPTLTWSTSGFVDVNGDWWTGVAAPTLTGTVADNHFASVKAFVGGTERASYTGPAGAWTLTLPAGTVPGISPVTVTVVAADAAGNTTSIVHMLRYDATPPVVTIPTSNVRDEAGDNVAFTRTIEPIDGSITNIHATHTHGGAQVMLGPSSSCDTTIATPTVTKYLHLLDQAAPPYVSEVAAVSGEDPRNPLRWQFTITDDGVGVDYATVQYRIRDVASNTFPLDWTPLAGSGTYSIPLYRTGTTWPSIAALGTKEGLYEIQFRGSDRLMRPSTAARCWQHKILAPPVVLGPLDAGGTQSSCGSGATSCAPTHGPVGSGKYGLNLLALNDTSAPFDPIASEVLNVAVAGTGMMQFPVWNAATDPVYLSVDLANPTGANYSKMGVENRWGYSETSDNTNCGPLANGFCDENISGCAMVAYPSPTPPATTVAGSTISGSGGATVTYGIRVWEELSSTSFTELAPCVGCSVMQTFGNQRLTFLLPARPRPTLAGDPAMPRKFWVVPVVKGIPDLRPNGVPPYSEFSTGGATLTGKIDETRSGCHKCELVATTYRCTARRTYRRYRALQQATFGLGAAVTSRVETSWNGLDGTVRPPPHLGTIAPIRSSSFTPWSTDEVALPSVPPP